MLLTQPWLCLHYIRRTPSAATLGALIKPPGLGGIYTPILQMWKLRHREVEKFAPSHAAVKYLNQHSYLVPV